MKREITIDYRTCDEETPALLLDPYPLREGETLVVRVLGHPLTQAPACFEGVLPECTTEIAALLSDTLAEGKCLTAVVKTRKELVSVPLHRSTASD
jgi:hypothetical protein